MSLEDSIQKREQSIINSLSEKQEGFDDATGKGAATENIVARQLLLPHLPTRFKCVKGAVVTTSETIKQSGAIDRVIYDPSSASPLVYDESHSVFPIESVCGLVEITMSLNATKLKKDIEHMAPVKAMKIRRVLVSLPNTKTRVHRDTIEALSPRSFIVGLPADRSWNPTTIAGALREIQVELGPPTHVHGLYVLGVGFFETVPIESKTEPMYRIRAWTGPDRLFRFTESLRQALHRWGGLPPGWSYDLQDYVNGQCQILAE